MRASLLLLASSLLLLCSCTMIDVRMAPRHGVHSNAFISGYADTGWPASDSLLQVGLLDGPSQGALLYLQVWKLMRVEVGFIGAAVGLGPLDCGVGVLLYDPHPPLYTKDLHGKKGRHGQHHGEDADDEEDEHGDDGAHEHDVIVSADQQAETPPQPAAVSP